MDRGDSLPTFMQRVFERYFFRTAYCAKCQKPMTATKTRTWREYDEGSTGKTKNFIVCDCGYPVWRNRGYIPPPVVPLLLDRGFHRS
jgi:hypothetical protein